MRAKIVIVGSNNKLKIIIFGLIISLFYYILKQLFTWAVSVASGQTH